MKALGQLLYLYFLGTPVHRAFSILGVVLIAVTFVLLRTFPQSFAADALAMAGGAAFYIGSSMMPMMFGRMARSRTLCRLPRARLKLLASGLLTLLIAALPIPLLFVYGLLAGAAPHPPHATALKLAQMNAAIEQTFWASYAAVTLFAAWLYVALWFITSKRNAVGFLQGLIIIAIVLVAPTRQIEQPDALVQWRLTECGATLFTFSVLFLLWPRLHGAVEKLRRAGAERLRRGPARVRGREVDLLLGTAHPWLLATGQLLPVLLAARIGFYSAAVWLFYLTIFSTVAGAIAGQAAERSRVLWLRGDWSPQQLFVRVERSFWRHNNYVLGILLVLMLVIGSRAHLPIALLALGVPLLILGTVLSTYLGLMLTRGLRLAECLLAVGIMLTLMVVAVLVARNAGDLTAVLALEALMALVAVGLRLVARARWARID